MVNTSGFAAILRYNVSVRSNRSITLDYRLAHPEQLGARQKELLYTQRAEETENARLFSGKDAYRVKSGHYHSREKKESPWSMEIVRELRDEFNIVLIVHKRIVITVTGRSIVMQLGP